MALSQQRTEVLVLGAGAWGTALAVALASRSSLGVSLWARQPEHRAALLAQHENARRLPGVTLPRSLGLPQSDLGPTLQDWRARHRRDQSRGLIILAGPMAGLAEQCQSLAAELGPAQGHPDAPEGLLWLAKGLVQSGSSSFSWPSDLSQSLQDLGWPVGVLSGPSFAQEVAAGLPVALTLASRSKDWGRETSRQLHGPAMRVYASEDLTGVQVGGAVKNVLAIAAGVSDGLSLGANARAALITRGLAESARLGLALGAQPETFMGLATLGDLVLTATGDLSRNRRVGLGLARGDALQTVVGGLGHVAEGVLAAPVLAALAQRLGVSMPITEAVAGLVSGQIKPQQALRQLLDRDPADENGSTP